MVEKVDNWNIYNDLMVQLYDQRNSLRFDAGWDGFIQSVDELEDGKYWGRTEEGDYSGDGVGALLSEICGIWPWLEDSKPSNEAEVLWAMRKIVESEPYGEGFWRPAGDKALFALSRDADDEEWFDDYDEMLGRERGETLTEEAISQAAEEEEAPGPEEEDIRSYGQGFMKVVDGEWRYGASRDAEKWYANYDQMLDEEGFRQPVAAPREIIEPYGEHFMKAVDGHWKFGRYETSVTWYDDYSEMLAAEGLSQPAEEEAPAAPVHVPDVVAALDLDGIDPRVFQVDSDLSREEAEAAFDDAPAAQGLVDWIASQLAETHDGLFDQIFEDAGELDPDELSQLAEGLPVL